MLPEKELHKFIKGIIQRVAYLESNDPDNADRDKLKLTFHVSKEGKIHLRSSTLNKQAHLFFTNCVDVMDRFENENLYN